MKDRQREREEQTGSAQPQGKDETVGGSDVIGAREGIVFTAEQQEALAGLASSNTYAKQSKWKTFRELPMKDKWPFFAQHFLGVTVAIVAAVAAVIAFVVNYVNQPPDPLLYIAGVNMASEYTEPMERLEQRFVSDQGLDPELVTYDANFTIAETGVSGGMMDGSSRLLTMASVGQVNTIITDADTFQELSARGLVTPLDDVLPDARIDALEAAGITVEAESSEAQGGDNTIKGLDLSRSAAWTSQDGLPDDAVLGFSNVTETGVDYPRAFVEFLDFS